VRQQSFLLSQEVDPSATRRLPAASVSSRKVRAMEITKDVDDVEIRLSAELDETSFQDTEYAVWVRNGEFKYETTVDPSKSDGKESKPKAADEKKLLADSSTDTRQVLASGTPSVLHGISVAVKPGELVAIVGQVGSGKSSLIQAILGELNKLKGDVVVRGSVAYVAQTAFIMNATLKVWPPMSCPLDSEKRISQSHSFLISPRKTCCLDSRMMKQGTRLRWMFVVCVRTLRFYLLATKPRLVRGASI
jgi:ABC transporter